MEKRSPLLILTLFAIAAFGINSVMFTELSYEMAATSGLSPDEVALVKVSFMIAQVLGFIFTPILVRRLGTLILLHAILWVGLTSNIVLYWGGHQELVFTLTWLASGFFMSMLMVVLNLYLLHFFEQRWLPAIIALTLVFSTLLPMGAYPWVVANIVEVFDWSLLCVVSAWLYFSALVMACLYNPKPIQIEAKPKSSGWFYLVLALTISLVVFLLMRGGYYNWFDSDWFVKASSIVAALTLLLVYHLVKTRPSNTASTQLHSKLKTNVFMYNAFLAGFAVMASNVLFTSFLKMALQYNSINAGYAQLPAFYAMLAGMLVSVLVYHFRRPLSDAVVPFGVVMIILSVHKFSQLPSFAGTESLPVPMLLRGFGVGLLNVSVTIAVLMYFHAGQRLEGIANFYLFRTIGGVIAGAVFSRVIQSHSAQASGEIGRTLDSVNNAFGSYEDALRSTILTHGHLPNSAFGMSQISAVVKEQVTTLALNNSLLMFIVSVFALAPVLLIGKKLAAKQSADETIETIK
ncbi:MFS transporter [Vibrio parahaemolyticus]|uniref:MFS transporter n=1 Tax=Vibrio parahaemolyticus TaxID=670 RepID=UPI001123C9A1|nr:MFS transporter [Vibrio parahaemolyticus]EIZ1044369.1 MFS transporter [Vibrio parahaemolyticus]ELA8096056.1 MFS transporter [Vibrio parahaemolyticus]MBE3753644.1 MFS transporter [Vibrio parahaemolyticus]MDF4342147.1 MFS transporter [Vibrio parahaemolyticus]MDF4360042.1 MFS transporter [Vibrio parahaemolyticus]